MNREQVHLSHHIDSLQARGQYFFSKAQIRKELNLTKAALDSSIKRLVQRKRVLCLKKGFYLIIPLEYQNIGAPPPDWFIDQLMKEHKASYYVGLLSAAALHGAAHQQPQIYQVITNKVLRPIKIGRARIVFYLKKNFGNAGISRINTSTGYMYVSTPELTAFDLVRYLRQSGHINHVSTVFAELGESISSVKLAKFAPHFSQVCVQRTGYILDYVDFSQKTKHLLHYVHKLPSRYYPLRPDKEWRLETKNTKWHLYINEQLEPDI